MKYLSAHMPLYLTWTLLLGAFALSLFERQWHTMAMAALTFVATIVPFLFQRRYNVYIPPVLTSAIALFAYATIFLGEVSNFYYRFWWWDLMLHMGSAIGFGLLGVVVLLLVFGKKYGESHPWIFALLSFCFAVSVGVLWEIYEFAMDQFLGTNMQKSGLLDTMTDLIINCVGATVAAVAGYLYATDSNIKPMSGLIEKWYMVNKKLFRGERGRKES